MFLSFDPVDNVNVVDVTWLTWLATALRCFYCNIGCCMSNVYIGNSIVTYNKRSGIPGIPYVKGTPPLDTLYKEARLKANISYVFDC